VLMTLVKTGPVMDNFGNGRRIESALDLVALRRSRANQASALEIGTGADRTD
jgi:hypothetical protein